MQAGTVAQGRGEAVNMTCQEQVRRVICGKGDTSYFQQTGTEAAGTGAGAGAGAGQDRTGRGEAGDTGTGEPL